MANGDHHYLEWSGNDFSGSGSTRNQFGIDNINAEVIPEPSTYALSRNYYVGNRRDEEILSKIRIA